MSTVAVRTDELIAGVPTLTATVQRVVREADGHLHLLVHLRRR